MSREELLNVICYVYNTLAHSAETEAEINKLYSIHASVKANLHCDIFKGKLCFNLFSLQHRLIQCRVTLKLVLYIQSSAF